MALSYDEIVELTHDMAKLDNAQLCKRYDTWAETYDKDFATQGYNAFKLMAPIVDEEFPDKSIEIIDMLAGTGDLGLEMKKCGFKNVDALDGSFGMLKKAHDRDIYRNYVVSLLSTEKPGIVSDAHYDGVVMCGGFVPGHVKGTIAKEFIRVLKPGGKCVLIASGSPLLKAYDPTLEKDLLALEGWSMLRKVPVEGYIYDIPGTVYVFRKHA